MDQEVALGRRGALPAAVAGPSAEVVAFVSLCSDFFSVFSIQVLHILLFNSFPLI